MTDHRNRRLGELFQMLLEEEANQTEEALPRFMVEFRQREKARLELQRELKDFRLAAALVQRILPFETEIAGQDTLWNIASGVEYGDVSGGLHFDLMDVISSLTYVTSIVQRVLSGIAGKAAITAKYLEDIVNHVAQQDPEAKAFLEDHPDIVNAIEDALRAEGITGDRYPGAPPLMK